jgi:hypothetical protein
MQTKFEQLLDYLVNEETEKAEELFHEIVVEKSRTIYENLIAEEEKTDDDEDKDKKHAQDEKVDEMFDDIEEESVLEIGGDPADDLVSDVEFGDEEDDMGDMGDMGDEEGDMDTDDEQDARIDDLEDALADLKAEFEKLMSDEEGDEEGEEEGDEEGEEMKEEDFLREYVDKVTDGHGAEKKGAAEKADNTKSPVAGENRMGGVTPKLGQGDEKGGVKGGLLNPTPKDMNTGNVNVKGGTNAKQFYSKDSKGHGAEKAGSGESNVNAKSPVAPSHAK